MTSRLKSALIVCLSLACAVVVPAEAGKKKPQPSQRFDHVVVVMMENRSFDHLLGWHPTADAIQEGLSYVDDAGVENPTYELAPDYQGCGHPDPDHSWQGGRIDYNGGAMDGFLFNNCDPATGNPLCPRTNTNDLYAIGFYGQNERPFFNALALNYTTFDNFYSSILAETYPNRIFMHSAQTDRLENSIDPVFLPTIWDRLLSAGVSARYYYSDVSFLWLWGFRYEPISDSYEQFLADARSGNLPAVSFVEPRFLGEEDGTSNDDHPYADVRAGDTFLAQTFNAVSRGPQWSRTLFIVTYDEWGGFFDHVPPPRAVAPNDIDPDVVDGKALLGLRIPVVVASPFTRGNPATPRVNSTMFDNTSILKLIESRWNLAPLTARDAPTSEVGNLTSALDLVNPNRFLPSLPNPAPPVVVPCPGSDDEVGMEDLIFLDPR